MVEPVLVASPTSLVGPGVWLVFDAWLRRASEVIGSSADALNALNVFPISDADTGSNLRLTLAGIARAVPDVNRASADAVVQAAILSAHGSSGAIVAEMFSSVCRSLGESAAGPATGRAGDQMALLLRTVADAARRAVARPVAGTILTVAEDAARAAERAARLTPEDPLAVARAAQTEARLALQRTPDQLEVLAAAGVVDAGGQAYALLVDALVEVLGGPAAEALDAVAAAPRPPAVAGPEYEVMYALRRASAEALDRLRSRLSELGESVVVVGGDDAGAGGLVQVHVHVDEPGPAIEAALGLGELSQIRVSTLEPAAGARSVVSVVTGVGLQQAVAAAGAVAVLGSMERPVLDELAAALARSSGDVVLLPNDPETLEAAGRLVARLRAERRGASRSRRFAVVPTVAEVQGLAALAVHEPEADFDTVVAAMSSAAGHTRHGAVTVTEAPATTSGRSEPGTVLGAVEGDVVETGTGVDEVAWRVVDRLLAGGGELLTLVLGAGAPAGLAQELTRRLTSRFPLVEVQVIDGGQSRHVVLVGLE